MQRLVDACLSACGLFSTGDQATLTSLDLSWNKLGPRGVADILQGLISNQVLTHLNVAFNGVGNAGVLKIADFLKKTTMLQWLDISHNRIGLEAIPTLVKGLINNMTLHTLKVGICLLCMQYTTSAPSVRLCVPFRSDTIQLELQEQLYWLNPCN